MKSYTIFTIEVNPLMSENHNSKKWMPAILARENETEWMYSQSIHHFAHSAIELEATAI